MPPDVGSISTNTARPAELAGAANRARPAANVLAPTPPLPPTTPITGATGSPTAASQVDQRGLRRERGQLWITAWLWTPDLTGEPWPLPVSSPR